MSCATTSGVPMLGCCGDVPPPTKTVRRYYAFHSELHYGSFVAPCGCFDGYEYTQEIWNGSAFQLQWRATNLSRRRYQGIQSTLVDGSGNPINPSQAAANAMTLGNFPAHTFTGTVMRDYLSIEFDIGDPTVVGHYRQTMRLIEEYEPIDIEGDFRILIANQDLAEFEASGDLSRFVIWGSGQVVKTGSAPAAPYPNVLVIDDFSECTVPVVDSGIIKRDLWSPPAPHPFEPGFPLYPFFGNYYLFRVCSKAIISIPNHYCRWDLRTSEPICSVTAMPNSFSASAVVCQSRMCTSIEAGGTVRADPSGSPYGAGLFLAPNCACAP